MGIEKSRFKPYYLYRYVRYRLGDRSPLACVLKITSSCNLDCLHCPWKEKTRDLPKERWFKIIDKAKDMGCVLCIIEGGEPLLRKDLNCIISHAKERGMLVSVITNGTMDFSGINPDAVWVSVDGTGKNYEKIRGFSFERVKDNIRENSGKNIIVLMSISRTNVNDMENLCKIFSPITKGIWFNFVYPYRNIRERSLGRKERSDTAKIIMGLKSRYNVINSDSYLKSVGKEWSCRPWLTLNVSSEGEMHHGCTVGHLEKCDCSECDMSCYGELSQAFGMKTDAVKFLKRSLGLKSDRAIFLKAE